MDGHVKCVYPDRGFGFIRAANYKDVFFHIRDSLIPEEDFNDQLKFRRVEFEIGTDPSGKERAINVKAL